MTQRLLFCLHAEASLAANLRGLLEASEGRWDQRRFPDGESYLRVLSDVRDADIIILCGLDDPDRRFLPLSFLADTLRECGARSVGLVAPYLAYMRQDKRFHEGEGVTSRYFAALLSARFDWLATVDPHLHRYHSLDEIYSIPSRVVHAAPVLADYLRGRRDLVLVGPDEESEQWVSALGEAADLPWLTARKQRHGDRDVTIELPDIESVRGLRPVLVDDVVSSGTTMERTLAVLAEHGLRSGTCLCVHGLFADRADERLRAAGAAELVATNTIPGPWSTLDVAPLLAPAVDSLLAG